MKLVSYETTAGRRHGVVRTSPGAAVGGEVVIDLGPGDLLALIEAGAEGRRRAGTALASAAPGQPLDGLRLLAPIRRPPKLLALAANYQEHIIEAGLPPVDKSRIIPKLFLKPSSAIVGPSEAVRLPSVSTTVDWEIELGVVIGKPCRNVSVAEALDHAAGYLVVNDVSARTMDWAVEREESAWNGFFDWLNGKWPDSFAPLGPYLVTADEVPDPQRLHMSLTVNGTVKQKASTKDMIFNVAEAIAFASRFMTLEPGDIIETGTPSGVGATTGEYLKAGDVMEAWIEGLGTLVTPVVGQ